MIRAWWYLLLDSDHNILWHCLPQKTNNILDEALAFFSFCLHVIYWFPLDCKRWIIPLWAWVFFKAASCMLLTNRMVKEADGLHLLNFPVELIWHFYGRKTCSLKVQCKLAVNTSLGCPRGQGATFVSLDTDRNVTRASASDLHFNMISTKRACGPFPMRNAKVLSRCRGHHLIYYWKTCMCNVIVI